MREQNGKRIVIAQPRQVTSILPPISQTSNHNRYSSQSEPYHNSSRKQKSKNNKISSLDKICLREYCKRKQQVYKQSTAQVIAKKQLFMANNKRNRLDKFEMKHHPNHKNEIVSKRKHRNLTEQGQIRPKNKIYFLHSLKQFEPEDIEQYNNGEMVERETQHKVNISQRNNILVEWKHSLTKVNIYLKNNNYTNTYDPKAEQFKEKQPKSFSKSKEKGQYTYNDSLDTQMDCSEIDKKFSLKDDARTSPTKKYYKYLQNIKTQEDNHTPVNNLKNKVINSEDDKHQSEESFFNSQSRKEKSTIFHSHKIKFGGSSIKLSRVKSSRILSKDQTFKIPNTEEQQTQFLLQYKPIDPDFSLTSIVGKQSFKIKKKEDKIYFGLVKGQLKHGLGILVSQKQIFEGEFIEDEKFEGIEKTKQGMYIGKFVKGMREGQAKFIWKNGEEFVGEWRKGKKDGHGIWKSPKGDFYEGEWKNNKQNGKGIFIHVSGSKYNGQFKDFLKHGRGEQSFANGDKYTGQYQYGKPHGFGKYIWANGDKYEGEFCQGSRQGQGILIKSNSECYQGSFVNDMKEGEGKQSYINGQYFRGQFKQDLIVRGKFYNKKGILLSQLN